MMDRRAQAQSEEHRNVQLPEVKFQSAGSVPDRELGETGNPAQGCTLSGAFINIVSRIRETQIT